MQFWSKRLADAGVRHAGPASRDGRAVLDFEDPEGQRLFLVDDDGAGASNPWERSPVPAAFQIRGLGPVTISVPDLGPTDAVLRDVLEMRAARRYDDIASGATVQVYEMGEGGQPDRELHVRVEPGLPAARQGAGAVHHIAFRTPDLDGYQAWAERLKSRRMPSSGPVDRYYFRSLYFREPNGILIEIATDGPGFATDEPAEALGETLALPPFLEGRRAAIEARIEAARHGPDGMSGYDDPGLSSAATMLDPAAAALVSLIDHTILKPEATAADVERFCREALRFGFASVCVNGVFVPLVAGRLHGSRVATCAVVGFPLGAMMPAAKAGEAAAAVAAGAREIDMVLHVGGLKAGEFKAVEADIAGVRRASGPALLKVIIETCLLTDDEKRTACRLAVAAGAAFVKTSTGFGAAGATPDDVSLMRATVGPDIGVKASGGIRTRADAERMVAAGASRIGASASVAIVAG